MRATYKDRHYPAVERVLDVVGDEDPDTGGSVYISVVGGGEVRSVELSPEDALDLAVKIVAGVKRVETYEWRDPDTGGQDD